MRSLPKRPSPDAMPHVLVNMAPGAQATLRATRRPRQVPVRVLICSVAYAAALSSALAQSSPASSSTDAVPVAVAAKDGKDGAPPRSFSFSPTFESQLGLINTSGQNGVSNTTDLALQVKPGFQAISRGGRLRGSATYFANASFSNKSTDSTRWQNSLNSSGTAELVPGSVYADLRASVTQRALSATGQQTAFSGQTAALNNQTEVANVAVSPYVRGQISDLAAYQVRWTGEVTNVRKSITGDFTNNGLSLRLGSPRGASRFGWGAEATDQRTAFRSGGTTDERRVILSAIARPEPDLTLTARAGRETANVATVDRTSYNNWGGGLQWTPNKRTSVLIDVDKRYFGDSYRVVLETKLPLSSISLSASRDTSTSQVNTGGAVTLFDFFFNSAANVKQYPDPIERAKFVTAVLLASGLNPNTVFNGGFVSSGVSVIENLALGWLYNTRRTTYAVQAFSTKTASLATVAANANGGFDVRQTGLNASALQRLTPTTDGTVSLSLLHTPGRNGRASTDLKAASLRVSEVWNRYTLVTLGASYSIFDSPTDPYREAALSATIALRF